MTARLFTIGHSVRPFDEFVALLRAHGVTGVADVRTIPRSRRHPHFSRESLEATLPAAGLVYRHFAALGGLRTPRRDSVNHGWRHDAFRGYADHMGTDAFQSAIDDLLAFARDNIVAVMCAEAKWWECHRQLIADALTAHDVEVHHIMARGNAPRHELTPFARVEEGRVWYPGIL